MQRFLSLATLAGLGAAVWMFLSGGGLSQLAVDPNAPSQTTAGQSSSGGWNSGPLPTYNTLPPVTAASGQPTTIGTSAPPAAAGPTIRIASFNVRDFGPKKLGNAAVLNALAEIIRRFDVVAIQEISNVDQYHLPRFVEAVNMKGRRYDFALGPRIGNSVAKEQYAYVFDTEKIRIDRSSIYTVGDPDNLLHREPYVALFSTTMHPDVAFTFVLVNVHTDPDVVPAELEALSEVYRVVRRASGNEDDIIMLGDFNASDEQIKKQSRLGQIPDLIPLVRGWSNVRQNKLYDNILVHGPSSTEYRGNSGTFDIMQEFNLSAAQAEQISDHFPVWAEFSAYERDFADRIASRATMAR